jgi:hypothetical protein
VFAPRLQTKRVFPETEFFTAGDMTMPDQPTWTSQLLSRITAGNIPYHIIILKSQL